jgi:hypothetical protein
VKQKVCKAYIRLIRVDIEAIKEFLLAKRKNMGLGCEVWLKVAKFGI